MRQLLSVSSLFLLTACAAGETTDYDQRDEALRAAVAVPAAERGEVVQWRDEHHATCEGDRRAANQLANPHGGAYLKCAAAEIRRVQTTGIPNLSAFCGKARPTKSFRAGNGKLYVLWQWCPPGSSAACAPQNVTSATYLGDVAVGACDGELNGYFSYDSGGYSWTWTRADMGGCTAYGSQDPVDLSYK